MEKQKTSNSQSDLEKEEWNWRNQPTWLQALLQLASWPILLPVPQATNPSGVKSFCKYEFQSWGSCGPIYRLRAREGRGLPRGTQLVSQAPVSNLSSLWPPTFHSGQLLLGQKDHFSHRGGLQPVLSIGSNNDVNNGADKPLWSTHHSWAKGLHVSFYVILVTNHMEKIPLVLILSVKKQT